MAATTFEGWLGKDVEAVNGKMEWGSFEPKKWTEDDVDIEISHCGICGSDMHTLKSGWGPTPYRESCPRRPSSLSPPPCSSRTNFFQRILPARHARHRRMDIEPPLT